MKYLLTSILFLVVASCFAVDQKLADAKEQYSLVELRLSEIENKIESTKKTMETIIQWLKWKESQPDRFRYETVINNDRAEIEEKQRLLDALVTQQTETKKILQQFEPLKNEYYKRKKIENEREELIESAIVTIVVSVLIVIFGVIIYFAIIQHKKYRRLLKEGKITQEEYDRIMQCQQSKSMFSGDLGVNPSTGLPLIGNGVCDAGGNLRGSSPIRSSFDYSQDCRNRHRWD